MADEPAESAAPATSPTRPAQTDADPDEESPRAFIHQWFRLNTEMQNTGDTSEFRAASRNCATCDGLAERVETIYAEGGFIRLEGQRVVGMERGAYSATIKQFDVTIRSGPTKYRVGAGKRLQHYSGGVARTLVTVVKIRGRWLMESLVAS